MARKSKAQVAVEEFESQFEDLVVNCLSNVDMEKIEEYLSSDLAEAVLSVLDAQEEEEEKEED